MATTIPQEAFTFFKKLEKNNNRDWFNERKPEFKQIEAEVKQFYNELLKKIQEHDEVDKLKMFRIYRDVRFSKNKAPYKTHFGGSYNRIKPKLRGGYYLQIAPGDSFIATGFWNPEKEDLLRIRKEFELDATEINDILNDKSFKNIWGAMVGDAVKTAPKGFNKEHENIELIRRKQFMFIKKYTDKEVLSADFMDEVNTAFKSIRPYFNLMSDILTTDLNGVSLID